MISSESDPDAHSTFEITHRPLTSDEARCLHNELKTTPNILGYTVRELTRLSDVHIAEFEDRFAGVCFCIDLALNWTEIAVVYVLPEFRGRGLGKRLFSTAWERAQERHRHLYVLSRNSQVVGWMRERDMTVNGNLWRGPLAVHWFMMQYMASWHRSRESVRKRGSIRQCPPLMQGMKK